MPALKEFRCKNCGLLLGMIDGNAEIVCRRCHGKNTYEKDTGAIKYQKENRKKPERTTSSGVRFYD